MDAGKLLRVCIALIRGRQLRVHIDGGKARGLCPGDVRFQIIADHQAVLSPEVLLVHQCLIKAHIGLPAAVVRGDVDAVQLIPQAQEPQLIGGEGPLGIAQQPQPVAPLPKQLQGIQDSGI